MAAAVNTVTIDHTYFETLLRKAQFHSGGADFSTPLSAFYVTIPKQDHESLLDAARQYAKAQVANLRRNLFRGGIDEETLAVLINDDATVKDVPTTDNYTSAVPPTNSEPIYACTGPATSGVNGNGNTYTNGRNGSHGHNYGHNYGQRNGFKEQNTNGFHNHAWDEDDGDDFALDGLEAYYDRYDGGVEHKNNTSPARPPRQQYEKFCKRTVLLTNLPEGTTHEDIVKGVRGGMILDLYLRTHDRVAQISFLEEASAQEFFRHVKRYDFYVRGKRVDIRWAERQFILPGHVANKITIGATRNLIIPNCSPKHTEEKIKEDLDHIHNLVVVKITFNDGNAYISLNSVHNSMFARTCLMSRSLYKGYKVNWDNDECAGPLEVPSHPRRASISKKKGEPPIANRFALLGMEDGEDEDEDENEDDTSPDT